MTKKLAEALMKHKHDDEVMIDRLLNGTEEEYSEAFKAWDARRSIPRCGRLTGSWRTWRRKSAWDRPGSWILWQAMMLSGACWWTCTCDEYRSLHCRWTYPHTRRRACPDNLSHCPAPARKSCSTQVLYRWRGSNCGYDSPDCL